MERNKMNWVDNIKDKVKAQAEETRARHFKEWKIGEITKWQK